MSYQALYRRFRPQTFDEVKGQDAIVTALKNQIINQRIGHAYLFCGTRGTGKTSIAKLFAKVINCENPQDGSPCGECRSCKAIAAGASMNVVEMDAASHNGVDDVRTINEEVTYPPTEGKYRVYIIDEVHMFSSGAFNALLKTLEEPPSYVIFILATTDVNKLPITILSRCQRYDFRRITIKTIADRMKELLDVDSVNAEPAALNYIAKCADGSMRDALSLLDRCIAFYFGEDITYDRALEVLGAVDTGVYSKMLRFIVNNDVSGAIRLLDELILAGRELSQFVSDFIGYMRNLLLVKTASGIEEIMDITAEHRQLLEEEAEMISDDALMRDIRVFSELQESMKNSAQKRILTEIALIKICRPQMDTKQNLTTVLERLSALEQAVENGIVVSSEGGSQNSGFNPAAAMTVSEEDKVPLPQALPEDIEEAVKMWKRGVIQSGMDGLLRSFAKQARISIEGEDTLILAFSDKNIYEKFRREESLAEVKKAFQESLNKEVKIDIRQFDGQKPFETQFADITQMKGIIDFDIEQEDE